MLTILAIAGLTLYAAAAAILYVAQRQILFRPDTTRPDVADARTLGLHEVTLSTGDNLRLIAWYLPPKPGRPVLAYFHGNGGNLADRIPRIRAFAALILESPYTNTTALAAARFPMFPVALIRRDPFDNLSRIDQVHAPILILQGAKDTIVPPAQGQTLEPTLSADGRPLATPAPSYMVRSRC